MCQTSVNLMPCCIKYTYRIQQKEQLGWRLEVTGNLGKGGWTKFEKGGGVVSNKGCLNKKGGLEPLCQLCKETKDFPSPHY